MSILYNQTTGKISLNGQPIGVCYSGFGPGLNNPAEEADPGIGPIPRGDWHIDRWDDVHGDKGPIVAVLSPVGHNAHGRTAFLIHGDNSDMNHTASHGCIIANKAIRQELRFSGQTELVVQ